MVRAITKLGDPVLRRICEEIDPAEILEADIQELIDDLIDTKRAANGAGIAAPQIGVLKRVFVAENKNNPRYPYKPEIPLTVVINPKITFLTEERFNSFEGCLSIPDLRGSLPRCPEIRVQGFDREGKPIDFISRGVSAGTFQHEDDHLNGVLFPDRIIDTRTLSTWEEFKKHHEDSFREEIQRVVEKYGS
jgi:peptide deformylase